MRSKKYKSFSDPPELSFFTLFRVFLDIITSWWPLEIGTPFSWVPLTLFGSTEQIPTLCLAQIGAFKKIQELLIPPEPRFYAFFAFYGQYRMLTTLGGRHTFFMDTFDFVWVHRMNSHSSLNLDCCVQNVQELLGPARTSILRCFSRFLDIIASWWPLEGGTPISWVQLAFFGSIEQIPIVRLAHVDAFKKIQELFGPART